MKRIPFKYLLYLTVCLLMIACKKDNGSATCDQVLSISGGEYNNASQEGLTINSITINDNCMKVNYSSSGCDGESWTLRLIDADQLFYSLPPQRYLTFDFDNDELCEAYITKETTFDISLIGRGLDEVILNIEAYADSSILFTP